MADSNKKVDAKKSPKAKSSSKIRNAILLIVFILINVAVIVATAVNEFGNSKSATELSEIKINWWLLLPATLCFLIAITFEIGKYVLMIRKLSKPNAFSRREAWKLARRTVLLGRYYDNITPAAVGGQPFQIYYMHKNSKLPTGLATTIPIFGMISLQISFIIIALIVFLFGGLMQDNPALVVTAWIGLLFYAFWPVMVGMATFFPKATTHIIKFVVKLFAKVKIIKNREEALEKAEKEVHEYVRSVKLILKTRGVFIKTILMSTVFNLLVASIPFFVLTAFGGDMDYWSCLTLTTAVMSAVYFIPTPGNSGAAEGTFYVVFSALSTGYVFWAMLFWRLFSYYIYIIMGPIIYFRLHLEKKHGRIKS
ncbi:flippase-like domain-containing protein [Candidatus Saccharibacteria bacterium]|nr:flippase-like domain-containing protein [Candidatus Saccharibacteria bacterium]